MRRGTTPTLAIHVDQDLSGCEVYVTLAQRGKQITKRESDFDMKVSGGATTINLTLSQAETLSFTAERGSAVEVQVRYVKDGRACATDIVSVPVTRILKEGSI